MNDTSDGVSSRLLSLVRSDNLDLYILAASALIFTVLGVFGISSLRTTSSVILGFLALLAVSQARSRHSIARIAASQGHTTSLFEFDFPPELPPQRAMAKDLLYIGISGARTVQSMRNDIRRMLPAGATIRVLLIDPTAGHLVREAASQSTAPFEADRLASRIRNSLDELATLCADTGGNLEIRVTSFVPRLNINSINARTPSGVIYVQHYEYRATIGEPRPIFRLDAQDGYWYTHFVDEAERMWDDGNPWPLAPTTSAPSH